MILGKNIDKAGTFGLFITAAMAPCCFPLFTFIGSALGLGSSEVLGEWTMWIFQAMALLSLIGLFIAAKQHKCWYPFTVGVISTALILYGYHFNESEYWMYFLYGGMAGLLGATTWSYFENKRSKNPRVPELQTVITCPLCLYYSEQEMPVNACVYFYECPNCHTRLKPKQGDCCVYCSYGTVKCPPMQKGASCC